jgi:hypothetical protein
MKNDFNRFICICNTTKDRSAEIFQTEKQRNKIVGGKKKNNKGYGIVSNDLTSI